MADKTLGQIFWEIFHLHWIEYYKADAEAITRDYAAAAWTARMLSKDDKNGFLDCVGRAYVKAVINENLHLLNDDYLRHEWNDIDLMGIGHVKGGDVNKSHTYFALEHENGKDLETEMWRLIHMRAPLKVLVCYTYSRSSKDWFENKIKELKGMLCTADKFYGKENAEYLIISGESHNAMSDLFSPIFLLAKD